MEALHIMRAQCGLAASARTCTVWFVDAPAGFGKTRLARGVTHLLRHEGFKVHVSATTGLAATNYPDGTTAHKTYKIPVSDEVHVACDFGAHDRRAAEDFLSAAHIWDEAANAHAKNIEAVERLLRDLSQSEQEWGGVPLFIFLGDFRQIAPVESSGDSTAAVAASLRNSPLWDGIVVKRLSINYRQHHDPFFANALSAIGDGEARATDPDACPFSRDPTPAVNSDAVDLPLTNFTCSERAAISFVFPQIDENEGQSTPIPDSALRSSSILCVTNAQAGAINAHVQDLTTHPHTPFRTYTANDSIRYSTFDGPTAAHAQAAEIEALTPTFSETLMAPGTPNFNLRFKVGDVCFIMRNLSFKDKLTNGTRVVVVSTARNTIFVRNISHPPPPGTPECETHIPIPRISFLIPCMSRTRGTPNFTILRRQFPLRLCYSMTIDKSQGQTLSRVAVDLRRPVFSHGQLYVALSRATSREHIMAIVPPVPDHPFGPNQVTVNYVAPSLTQPPTSD